MDFENSRGFLLNPFIYGFWIWLALVVLGGLYGVIARTKFGEKTVLDAAYQVVRDMAKVAFWIVVIFEGLYWFSQLTEN
jgi:hypothetical protein